MVCDRTRVDLDRGDRSRVRAGDVILGWLLVGLGVFFAGLSYTTPRLACDLRGPVNCTIDPTMGEKATDTGKSGLRITLLSHEGRFLGTHRALGASTPVFLFKGDAMYVHGGRYGSMRLLAPRERPFVAMIALPTVTDRASATEESA